MNWRVSEWRRLATDRFIYFRLRLRRKWFAFEEGVKCLLRSSPIQQEFCIVTCERNAGYFALKCLDSVYRQRYDREKVRHIFIDDASTDGTHELILEWLQAHPDHRVDYRYNSKRLGGTANTLQGFLAAPAGTIVIELNGDDWLADGGVLAYLNRIYADPEVWMTYNTPRNATGPPALWAEPIPEEVVADNAFRDMAVWISSHPHTFRRELFDYVREETLMDPETGTFWESADDQAIYLAMLELAGRHSRHLHRTLYVYNFHDQSHYYSDGAGSEARARRIRRQPKYQPLGEL